jgi:hypothetical protein
MGEFMQRIADGERVKVGTCEDLYYLRFDQLTQVRCDGDADPERQLDVYRFRFPWPDEDRRAPGDFDRYDRSCGLHGLTVPAGVEHGKIQFVSQRGFNMVIPCPEDAGAEEWRERAGVVIHRNGYGGALRLCQQAVRETELGRRLVGVCECGGCGHKFWLSAELAIAGAAVLLAEAESRQHQARIGPHYYDSATGTYDEEGIAHEGQWYRDVAERLLEGYSPAWKHRAAIGWERVS